MGDLTPLTHLIIENSIDDDSKMQEMLTCREYDHKLWILSTRKQTQASYWPRHVTLARYLWANLS